MKQKVSRHMEETGELSSHQNPLPTHNSVLTKEVFITGKVGWFVFLTSFTWQHTQHTA